MSCVRELPTAVNDTSFSNFNTLRNASNACCVDTRVSKRYFRRTYFLLFHSQISLYDASEETYNATEHAVFTKQWSRNFSNIFHFLVF